MKQNFFYCLFIASLCRGLFGDSLASSADISHCLNGLPNPSARFNADCRSFDFFATLLYWTAFEVGADSWAEVIITEGSTSSNTLVPLSFGWDPGFKIGLGYGMEHDQWDTQVYFTWFHTQGDDRISDSPGTVHSTFMGNFWVSNPDGSGLSGPSYQHASIDWTIKFNLVDWELGRNFWVSNSLALRPFVAAKGGWIQQSIHSKWQNPSFDDLQDPLPFNIGTEKIKNDFWGIGPATGLNTRWHLSSTPCHTFYIFGDFSGALMWGNWSFSDVYNNDSQEEVIVSLKNVNSGATMVRSFMGLGWNASLSENRYQFSAKLGYETQFWLDQLQFYSFIGGTLNVALMLQGGAFDLSFNF